MLWINEHPGLRFATVAINVLMAKLQAVGQKFDINMEIVPNPGRLESKRPPSFLLRLLSKKDSICISLDSATSQ